MSLTSQDCTDRVGSIPEYLTPDDIRQIAEARVQAELRDRAIEREADRLRKRLATPWWKRALAAVFPFKITITRRNP